MKVQKFKMKFLGKSGVLFRVINEKGEVLQVLETQQEAEAYINAR